MNSPEHSELKKFYTDLLQEVLSTQLSEEEGGIREQIFTQLATDMLADAGETENVRVAHDEKSSRRGIEHKISGYALPDNYETLDLFITIFSGFDEIQAIPKATIDTAANRITNFFRNAVYKDYVGEIEESSEIFDLAHTLSEAQEVRDNLVRVNIFILTDGIYNGDAPESRKISGYPMFYRVIDLAYLFNLTEKSRIPIEIDFESYGTVIPCIPAVSDNEEYQAFLAVVSGELLADIYEKYGSRLLEQNVRSFLQFTGKINKGIRRTILDEPQMFLAYNNGIAATAEEVKMTDLPNGIGQGISWVRDLQIVNGGQTTASIYHTWKKDKANISGIQVPLKLSVVRDREKFSEIVSRISEYANTQNRVSVADLSSNRPFHIELEKLSRTLWAPPAPNQSAQTHWFYERARGQYKNALIKEGFTKAKRKSFEAKNPRSQMFNKEDLAKYVNAWREVFDGKKLVIGPHIVVRGGQKNYVQFVNYNMSTKLDNIYFEDAIALAILFRSAEKIYGVKPNAIGDMRYITVPYSISWLGFHSGCKLDLYKIWKNQSLSENLKTLLRQIMENVEAFIRQNAPGALYGEWAKKEECWNSVKVEKIGIDKGRISSDLESEGDSTQPRRINEVDTNKQEFLEKINRIKSVTSKGWQLIEKWGRATNLLSVQQRDLAFTIATRVRTGSRIAEAEANVALHILNIVLEKEPELLWDVEEEPISYSTSDIPEITPELVKQMIAFDRHHKRLEDYKFRFIKETLEKPLPWSEKTIKHMKLNYERLRKFGFREEEI
jgi:hypothetical protein